MIHAVLFDLFETLITESAVRPTPASSLGEMLGLDSEAFRAAWKTRRPGVVRGQLSFREALAEICHALTGSVEIATIQRLCEQRVAQKAAAFARVSDDVAALISDLTNRGIAVGLVSNCFEEDVRAWTACPIAHRFRCAVFSFAEGVAKPDAEIYRRAVRRLGVPPARTLFVGDGGDDELYGAEQAGLHAVHASWFAANGYRLRSKITCVDAANTQDVLKLVASG